MTPSIALPIVVLASWYSATGKLTAYKHRYSGADMTCAADDWPDGTILEIKPSKYPYCIRKPIKVKVTDKLGPKARELGRALDLSQAAFSKLAPLSAGVINVQVISATPP